MLSIIFLSTIEGENSVPGIIRNRKDFNEGGVMLADRYRMYQKRNLHLLSDHFHSLSHIPEDLS